MADLVAFWDPISRNWIVYAVDAEGHQLWEADFYANRGTLSLAWANGGKTQYRSEVQ